MSSPAAAELCVAAGAISQQIAKLEDFDGRQLFIRRHHQLALTDTGQTVYATRAATHERVSGADRADRWVVTVPPTLVISVLPSVGIRWLSHHLSDFLMFKPRMSESTYAWRKIRSTLCAIASTSVFPMGNIFTRS
jgi:LysR family glycine cleavage system transcriptional activator